MSRQLLLARAGATLLLVGGLLLVIGPFAMWASVRPDAAAFSEILAESRSQVRSGLRETTVTYSWLEHDGRAGFALAAGAVVVVAGAVTLRTPRRWPAIVGIVGASMAAGLALSGRPDPGSLVDAAVKIAARWAVAVRVDPHALRPAFIVTIGRSGEIEIVGAAVALVGAAIMIICPGTYEGDPDWVPWSRRRQAARAMPQGEKLPDDG